MSQKCVQKTWTYPKKHESQEGRTYGQQNRTAEKMLREDSTSGDASSESYHEKSDVEKKGRRSRLEFTKSFRSWWEEDCSFQELKKDELVTKRCTTVQDYPS